jgi:hypothetical protein
MNRPQEQTGVGRKQAATALPARLVPERPEPRPRTGRPRVSVALRSSQGKTEVQFQLSWCYRVSGPAAARLLIVLVLVLAATAAAMLTNDELARGVLYGLAGFLTGSRPLTRS